MTDEEARAKFSLSELWTKAVHAKSQASRAVRIAESALASAQATQDEADDVVRALQTYIDSERAFAAARSKGNDT